MAITISGRAPIVGRYTGRRALVSAVKCPPYARTTSLILPKATNKDEVGDVNWPSAFITAFIMVTRVSW